MRKTVLLLVAAFGGALLSLAGARSTCAPPGAPVVVFVMRHAEKEQDGTRDPPLNQAGQARAEALAGLLADAKVTHLFATDLRRTQQTLAPIAQRRPEEPLAITSIAATATDPLLAALRDLPAGAVAVVAGHSNTVPTIVRGLGGEIGGTVQGQGGEMLRDEEYGRLVQLILPPPGTPSASAPSVRTLQLHVGAR